MTDDELFLFELYILQEKQEQDEDLAFLEWSLENEKAENDLLEIEIFEYMDKVFENEMKIILNLSESET